MERKPFRNKNIIISVYSEHKQKKTSKYFYLLSYLGVFFLFLVVDNHSKILYN
nr:MAG TPA: hypothetical protein [Caudoviricetes sp.]